jgi:hypothetical protein
VEEQFVKWTERLPAHAGVDLDGFAKVLCSRDYPQSLRNNNDRQGVKDFDSIKKALENRVSNNRKTKESEPETEALETFIQPEEIIFTSPPETPRPEVRLPKLLAWVKEHMVGSGFSPAENNYDLLYVACDKGFVEEESVGFWVVTKAGREEVENFIKEQSVADSSEEGEP